MPWQALAPDADRAAQDRNASVREVMAVRPSSASRRRAATRTRARARARASARHPAATSCLQ
ncbi:MAG: hypothetical protein MZW92_65835 [Comamonadaceae bacterium]|nr:hypothetical protein [Comamonadaceae bacterium]